LRDSFPPAWKPRAPTIGAGLVDKCLLFLTPIVVGGGKPALPENVRATLELLGEHRLGSGVVHLHYCMTV
jgi:dihydrofolate reductase